MATQGITLTTGSPTAKRRGIGLYLLAGVGALLVLAAGYMVFMAVKMSYVPPDLDYSTTRLSENGDYRATIRSAASPIPVNQLHSWTLHVETPDGHALDKATITVDGDMPQHGHGMPTRPQVTRSLGNGDYLVEGMKFQMGGWWMIEFTIANGDVRDVVKFNLMLTK